MRVRVNSGSVELKAMGEELNAKKSGGGVFVRSTTGLVGKHGTMQFMVKKQAGDASPGLVVVAGALGGPGGKGAKKRANLNIKIRPRSAQTKPSGPASAAAVAAAVAAASESDKKSTNGANGPSSPSPTTGGSITPRSPLSPATGTAMTADDEDDEPASPAETAEEKKRALADHNDAADIRARLDEFESISKNQPLVQIANVPAQPTTKAPVLPPVPKAKSK